MANIISLMEYVQVGLPFLPLGNPPQSQDNTANTDYSANDISHVGHWSDFNLINILNHYGPLLAEARIQEERISGSPPHPINGKMGLEFRYAEYLQGRVIRALQSRFELLVSHDQLKNQTIVSFGEGELVQSPDDSTPSDTAYFASHLPWSTRPNRLPGILKPSYEWLLAWRDAPNVVEQKRKEFKQVLSEVNWHMIQHSARYGLVLTDCELVAIRRLDKKGNLELSDSIPWTTQGTADAPKLTVLLALWYLGMLAADNDRWRLD
jgi:hypothetical protein